MRILSNHPPRANRTAARISGLWWAVCLLFLLPQGGHGTEGRADFIPLPDSVLIPKDDPASGTAKMAIQALSGSSGFRLPDSLVIHNEDGNVVYDQEKGTINYTGDGKKLLYVRTGEGHEIYASEVRIKMDETVAEFVGPLVIYYGDTLTYAESGSYDWQIGYARANKIRAKVQGMLVRGSAAEYKKDSKGRTYMVIHDGYLSSEDVRVPQMWVGTGELTVYPGDYGRVSRLSIATAHHEMRVPILGWLPITHSLNPEEGYMPMPGAKSIWGIYLCNRYGFLLGNRRTDGAVPTADYLATALLDYRVRRGVAGGVELRNLKDRHRYGDARGLSIYFAADKHPNINPVRQARKQTKHNRYRLSLSTIHKFSQSKKDTSHGAVWSMGVDINALGDGYMLQDFFEDEARVNNRPDNNVRLVRRDKRSQTMFFARFAPNNYYSTDERAEISYYRTRTAIGKSSITYETRNSASVMHQFLTCDQRMTYQQRLRTLRDEDVRNYYLRLLNDGHYARLNSTHELTTSVKVLRFLNITPKVGGGFAGYYGVDEVGADNRFFGYVGCDFDIKFYRHFPSVRIPLLGINGLYHVFHPYAGVSHGTISSSNPLVPEVDTWSTRLGGSTVNPMPLDLMEFTGIDGWGRWTVWRLGVRNTLSTVYDGETRSFLNWNLFLDYNIDNPNTESIFSNLYSIVELDMTRQCRLVLETQTPTVKEGDGFYQYNTSLQWMVSSWLETQIGHRYIKDHPIQGDANYAYIQGNIRLNERYTIAARVSWDTKEDRVPIQQFSFSRKLGAWYTGATLMFRDNGGKKETGFGISFTLGETGTSFPIDFF